MIGSPFKFNRNSLKREISEQDFNFIYDVVCEIENNYISKDRIREKLKEIENGTYDAKIILEQLLEEGDI